MVQRNKEVEKHKIHKIYKIRKKCISDSHFHFHFRFSTVTQPLMILVLSVVAYTPYLMLAMIGRPVNLCRVHNNGRRKIFLEIAFCQLEGGSPGVVHKLL